MINLLPTDVKQNVNYAHRNTKLRNWIIVFLVSILGVGVITVFGLFYINQSSRNYSAQINRTEAELQAQHIDDAQTQVKNISDSLKLVVQVLSREVLFSKLIKQVATAIPDKAILTRLDISKIQGGIDISANAVDYDTATQVLVNLQDPANKIFDKADLIGINCSKATSTSASAQYPCTVTIRAQFAKTNPFLFINDGGKKK